MKKITENYIRDYLENLPFSFEIFDVIDSTNSYAKKAIAFKNSDKRVIISDMQTNGRGRLGREFYSPKDNGIYMSIILKVDKAFDDLNLFTVSIAALTLKAIEKVTGKECSIKWVNDIFIKDKKVCGILCENILDKSKNIIEYIVVGIGINVKSTEDFPENIASIAGATEELDRNELIAEILKEVYELSKDFAPEKYLDFYRTKSLVLNKNIRFIKNGVEYQGRVLKINDFGNLEVELSNGTMEIIKSGEIRLAFNDIS